MIPALIMLGLVALALVVLAIWSALIADADLPHWYDDPGDEQ